MGFAGLFSFLNQTSSGTVCTAAGCYLSQNGGLVSLPLVTVAGLIDGLNPCAIGMIILLLGYLIVFAGRPDRVFKTGLVYIAAVYLTYLAIGLFFYKSIRVVHFSLFRDYFNLILGIMLILAGLINVKDYFRWDASGLHLQIPDSSRPFLLKWVEKVSLPSAAILGILVTFLETPCSLPIYVGTASILSDANLPRFWIAGYFVYYNFLFVLPLIIIWLLIWRGGEITAFKEWEHRAKKWMKLSIGVLLILMAVWILVFR